MRFPSTQSWTVQMRFSSETLINLPVCPFFKPPSTWTNWPIQIGLSLGVFKLHPSPRPASIFYKIKNVTFAKIDAFCLLPSQISLKYFNKLTFSHPDMLSITVKRLCLHFTALLPMMANRRGSRGQSPKKQVLSFLAPTWWSDCDISYSLQCI